MERPITVPWGVRGREHGVDVRGYSGIFTADERAEVSIVHRWELSDRDRVELTDFLSQIDWGFAPELQRIEFYGRPDWRILVRLDGRLVAHAGIAERLITVGERTLRVAGVCTVASLPEVRAQGLGALAMRRTIEHVCANRKIRFGLLGCGLQNVPFYEKLGWRVISSPVTFLQGSGKTTFPSSSYVLIYRCSDEAWPDGPVDLQGLPW